MMSRSLCCALLIACALGCTNDSTPTSIENPANQSPALAGNNAEVHTIVVLTQEADYQNDGTIDETYVIRTSYDRHGNALLVEEEDNRAGSIRRMVTTSSYNRWGNALEQVIDLDFPQNGPRDTRYWITTVETDRAGRPIRRVYLLDYDLDGIPDHESNTLSYPAYDPLGKPLQEVLDFDTDGDGTLDSRTTQTMAYDHHGNVEQRTIESDFQIDGSVNEGSSTKSTYNAYGAVVEAVSKWFADGDGVSTSSMTTIAFDGRGNPITQVSVADYAPTDGVADSRRVVTTSFDERHRRLSEVEEIDLGADGTIDGRYTRTYEYFGTLTIPSGPTTLEMSSAGQPRDPWSGGDDANRAPLRLAKPRR